MILTYKTYYSTSKRKNQKKRAVITNNIKKNKLTILHIKIPQKTDENHCSFLIGAASPTISINPIIFFSFRFSSLQNLKFPKPKQTIGQEEKKKHEIQIPEEAEEKCVQLNRIFICGTDDNNNWGRSVQKVGVAISIQKN